MAEPPEAITLDDMAEGIARMFIDLGAACQKARCFSVVDAPGGPLRSVYAVSGEKLATILRQMGCEPHG
jgi:hypothetical protein